MTSSQPVSANNHRPDLVHELARGLRQAAREAASDGKPEAGAAYLRQALALLPEDAARVVLADLAGIESLYDMPSAVEHFGELLTGAGSAEILAEAASALLALNPSVKDEGAWIIAREAIADCDDADLRLRLLARIGVAAALAVDAGPWREQVMAELRGHGSLTTGARAALGVTVFDDLWRGRPLAEVQRGAESIFRNDWVASLHGNDASYGLGLAALVITDSPLLSQTIDEGLIAARQRAASGYEGGVLAVRAHMRLRAGDLHGAALDGRAAFDTYRAYGGGPVPLAYALAALIEAERELGHATAVRRALAQAPSDIDAGTLGLPGIRFARVRARAAAGAPAAALDELLRIGADYQSLGGVSPALLPWRSEAALLAKRIGRDADALELADAELAVAAEAGPRALARALAARAAVGPPAEAMTMAADAVNQLVKVQAPLELAQALLVQGSAHAGAATVEPARQAFARALQLAERAGAVHIARAAREGLVRVGGRPRRGASIGVDGLTGAERAVAYAAARGLSNREIAASLYIAPGTVKNQLASAYRKLSVSSRSQLPDVLGSDAV